MPKKKLIEIIKGLLKSDVEMLFLHQLSEEELNTLADAVRERIEELKGIQILHKGKIRKKEDGSE